MQQRVTRRFENISNRRAHLLAIVLGGAESITEVEYTPEVGERVKALSNQATFDLLVSAGVRFDAGQEAGRTSRTLDTLDDVNGQPSHAASGEWTP